MKAIESSKVSYNDLVEKYQKIISARSSMKWAKYDYCSRKYYESTIVNYNEAFIDFTGGFTFGRIFKFQYSYTSSYDKQSGALVSDVSVSGIVTKVTEKSIFLKCISVPNRIEYINGQYTEGDVPDVEHGWVINSVKMITKEKLYKSIKVIHPKTLLMWLTA